MANDLLKQWMELTQSSMDSFKELTENNTNALKGMLGQSSNAGFSEMTKASMEMMKQFNEMYTTTLNNVFQHQFNSLDAEAIKSLNEINMRTMNDFMQKHMELVNAYVDISNKQVEALKQANDLKDVINVHVTMYTEVHENLKDKSAELFKLSDTFKSALSDWTEKNFEKTGK